MKIAHPPWKIKFQAKSIAYICIYIFFKEGHFNYVNKVALFESGCLIYTIQDVGLMS